MIPFLIMCKSITFLTKNKKEKHQQAVPQVNCNKNSY
jgi:hypothetical protein